MRSKGPIAEQPRTRWILSGYFLLAMIQGLVVLIVLLRIPAEQTNARFLGFSAARLGFIAGTALIILACLILASKVWIDPGWLEAIDRRLEIWLSKKKVRGGILLLSLTSLLGGIFFFLLGGEVHDPFTQAYFTRLQPFALWLAGMGALTLTAILLLQGRLASRERKSVDPSILLAVALFTGFLLLWFLFAQTRLGLVPESVGWYELGAPVLETQALLAWAAGLSFLGLSVWAAGRSNAANRLQDLPLDAAICLLLWGGATLLWWSQPLPTSWFLAPGRPPNGELYPNSDSILYDSSGQTLLIGEGLKSENTPFAKRPMYGLLIAAMHAVAGQDYERVVFLQVCALAALPALIYLLTTRLYNRLAGLIAALLILFREANSIQLSGQITVSHAKVLMADLPATVGVVLFTLLVMAWLSKPEQHPLHPLLAGGVLGVTMLIRPESGILLLAIGAIAAVTFHRRSPRWALPFLGMVLGILLVYAPWTYRNWKLSGELMPDSPTWRTELLAQRYNPVPETAGVETQMRPDETRDEFMSRLTQGAVQFVKSNPGEALRFIANNFSNSLIQTALTLPTAFRPLDSAIAFLGHRSWPQFLEDCCRAESFIRRLPYWHKWDGHLPGGAILPLVITLALIAVGISQAWRRRQGVGLVPLLFGLTYLVLNALFRNSGGRYILPVDWFSIVYYGIGLSQATQWVITAVSDASLPAIAVGRVERRSEPEGSAVVVPVGTGPGKRHSYHLPLRFAVLAACVFALGAAIPLAEKSVPPRFRSPSGSELYLAMVAAGDPLVSHPEARRVLDEFIAAGGEVLRGRALYPRFYRPEQGESGSYWPFVFPRPFSRVSFYLIGPRNLGVVLPVDNRPVEFPNASDVLVFGCSDLRTMDAIAVLILDGSGQALFRAPMGRIACPLDPLDE